MKTKTFFLGLVAMMMSATNVNSQTLIKKVTGEFLPIAGSVTNDGKGRLMVVENFIDEEDYEYGVCSIYNTSMQEEVRATITPERYSKKSGTMTAKTNLKASDVVEELYSEIDESYTVDVVKDYTGFDPTTAEGLAAAFKAVEKCEKVYSFTDSEGHLCVCEDDPYCFFNYEKFGRSLPYGYFALEGNKVNYYRKNYSFNYQEIYKINTKSLSWTMGDNMEDNISTNVFVSTCITNIDNGDNNVDTKETLLTQNLFNSDDKWEYIITSYDPAFPVNSNNNISEYCEFKGISEDGYVIVSTYGEIYDGPQANCMKIMQTDGSCVVTLPFIPDISHKENFNVFVIGGKPYFELKEYDNEEHERYTSLYSFDKATKSLSLVRKAAVSMSSTPVAKQQSMMKNLNK